MSPPNFLESTSGLPDADPDPKPAPKLSPAVVALSFTIIAVQIQAAAPQGIDSLLPILVAALLALAGASGALRDRFALRKYPPP